MLRLRNDCGQGQKKPILTVSDTWPTAWLDLPLSNILWHYIDFTILPHTACAGIRLPDMSPIIAWREASETKMSIGYDSCLFVPCSEDIECNKCSFRQASWHPSNKHVVYNCPTEWHKSVFWSDASIFCQCPPKLPKKIPFALFYHLSTSTIFKIRTGPDLLCVDYVRETDL